MISIVTIDKVTKKYPEENTWALKNIDLEIEEGEFFCLIGPSGSGKSTLLKLIAGIEKPTSGKISGTGEVSMVFQSGALLPWLTVEDNASFGLRMKGLDQKLIQEKTEHCINMVGLKDFYHKFPRELSGGQRQRVGIARALSMETPILLLDEPFSALDAITTEELHKDLLKIWQTTKKTILMVSHLVEEAILLADRVGVVRNGELKEVVEVRLMRPRNVRKDDFVKFTDYIKSFLR